MMNTIDTRGYSCPEPVIMTRKAIAAGTPLTVLVDSETPLQNVTRFAASRGYIVAVQQEGVDYTLSLKKA